MTGVALPIQHRVWHVDPYMSDSDLRDLLRKLPPAARLQGRPTGEKRMTDILRMNMEGALDEKKSFAQTFCVVL